MKLVFYLIILLGLFSSCTTTSYTYKKPVIGLIYYEKIPIVNISVIYDSLDVLSPRNITTDKRGRFILPKIEVDNYQDYINSIKRINSIVIIKKEGYISKKIDLKKYDKNKDSITVGIIQLEKVK